MEIRGGDRPTRIITTEDPIFLSQISQLLSAILRRILKTCWVLEKVNEERQQLEFESRMSTYKNLKKAMMKGLILKIADETRPFDIPLLPSAQVLLCN